MCVNDVKDFNVIKDFKVIKVIKDIKVFNVFGLNFRGFTQG